MSSLVKEDVELLPRETSTTLTRPSLRTLIMSYVLLFVSVVVFAAVGPTFIILTQTAKIGHLSAAAYRNQLVLVMVFPFCAWEVLRTRPSERAKWWIPRVQTRWCPQYFVGICVFLASVGWCCNLIFWLSALQFTTTVRASLVVNTHPFILTLFYLLLGRSFGRWTLLGVFLCAAGLVLSELPAILGENEDGKSGEERLIGDLLSFVAAGCDATYYAMCGRARKSVPVYTFTMLTTIVCTFGLTIAAAVETKSFAGIVGWVLLDQLSILYFLIFAFSIGVVGLAASNYSLGNLDPLVCSAASLLVPLFTGIIAYLTEIEGIPGTYTIVGGLIVLSGLGIMSVGEHQDSKTAEIPEEHASASVSVIRA